MNTKATVTNDSSPGSNGFATASVRIYRRDEADAEVHSATAEESAPKSDGNDAPIGAGIDAEIKQAVQGMIAARKMQRDLTLLADDPAALPGFDRLPAQVQAIAEIDPMSFMMLRQLGESGVDLHAMVALHDRIQHEIDTALRADGWDGVRPLTDAELDRAGEVLRRLMEE